MISLRGRQRAALACGAELLADAWAKPVANSPPATAARTLAIIEALGARGKSEVRRRQQR